MHSPKRSIANVRRLIICAALATTSGAIADTAVNVPDDLVLNSFPAPNTTFGWQFSVNQSILVTHIGLFDHLGDGFEAAHDMGLWNEEGSLIWSDTLQAGEVHPIEDQFRYVSTASVANGGFVLAPGQEYTIAYFTDGLYPEEDIVMFEDVTVDETINYAGFSVRDFTDGLEMPTTPADVHAFGPNFQFQIVPAPAAMPLLALGLIPSIRRRRPE